MDPSDLKWAGQTLASLSDNIETVIHGQKSAIRYILAGFAGGGHILLEDNPGTGKTTLAKALAKSIDADFKRVQFTPDLLPSDILGVSIFDPSKHVFNLHRGPVFTNILLADEINRASPRTQSALLEAMAENQVSIDGELLNLKTLFFVIATQNPVESRGTYPLPEAQMDRFCMQLELGYVTESDELAIMAGQKERHPVDDITPCITLADFARLKALNSQVHLSDAVRSYIVRIINGTRNQKGILLGASPRASLALMKTASALALTDNLDYVLPDHIQEIAVSTIAHRLVLDPQSRFSGLSARKVVEDILNDIPVPV